MPEPDPTAPRKGGRPVGSLAAPTEQLAARKLLAFAAPIASEMIKRAKAGDVEAAALCLNLALVPIADSPVRPPAGD